MRERVRELVDDVRPEQHIHLHNSRL
jgi:hypothetical protein